MDSVRPTRRLTQLCCTAIDRFVHAHRTKSYAAGVARVFRSDVVWKLAKDFIRMDSPRGQVAGAIGQVEELPQDEQDDILAEVLDRARHKATELNETATEPVGTRPMQKYASYVLEGIDGTHQQCPSSSGALDSGIQFAFYKPPSSSSPSASSSQLSPHHGPGPIRRKRRSRKRPTQPGHLSRDNIGLLGSGSSMVERPGFAAVDVPKMAEGNSNFESSLYDVQSYYSSTSGQGNTSSLVPSLAPSGPNQPGFPYSVQGSDSVSSNLVCQSTPSVSEPFNNPPQAPHFENRLWCPQQQIPGNINSVGLGDLSSDAGFEPWAQGGSNSNTPSSHFASVYHTPDSTFTRYLEPEGIEATPQLPYDAATTHGAPGPRSLLDNTGPGLVGLPSLSEMPLTSFGSQDNHSLWDDRYFEGYQDLANVPANIGDDFTRLLSNPSSSPANSVHHTQSYIHRATQSSSHSSSQDDPLERNDSAQWCEDGRARQDGRRPEKLLRYQQFLSEIQPDRMDRQGRGYQSSSGALFGPPAAPPLAGNDVGTPVATSGQPYQWDQGSFDAWNALSSTAPTHQNPSNTPSYPPVPNHTPYANQCSDGYTYQNSGLSSAMSPETAAQLGHTFFGTNANPSHLGTPVTNAQRSALLYGQGPAQSLQRSDEQPHPPSIPALPPSVPTSDPLLQMTNSFNPPSDGQTTYYGPLQTRESTISHGFTAGSIGSSWALNHLGHPGGTE